MHAVTLTDGSKVDSSRDRGAPYVFKIGTVKQKVGLMRCSVMHGRGCMGGARAWIGCTHLTDRPVPFVVGSGVRRGDDGPVPQPLSHAPQGFDEGVATMRAGERARFTCSPDYAFGTAGSPPLIPPNVTVVFDIELLAMKRSWWRL